eukprot:1895407-Pleurochrysis_carterae.AAC.1
MEAQVRACKRQTCESLVDLETLSQRLPALVADEAAVCMQTIRSSVCTARGCRSACTTGEAQHQQIESYAWALRQRCLLVRSKLVRDLLILSPSASTLQPSLPMPLQSACRQIDCQFQSSEA